MAHFNTRVTQGHREWRVNNLVFYPWFAYFRRKASWSFGWRLEECFIFVRQKVSCNFIPRIRSWLCHSDCNTVLHVVVIVKIMLAKFFLTHHV